MTEYRDFSCDLCGSDEAAEILEAKHYTAGQPLHVCRDCGFVFVRSRRSAQAIAASWSDDLFGAKYTARIPAVVARLTFVTEMIHQTVGLKGKAVCDIGAGEGAFLDMIRAPQYGADVYGIEPSTANGRLMEQLGLPHMVGTIEDYVATKNPRQFDVATIMWTLENCQDCLGMLRAAAQLVRPGGHVVVSTGSRILVPFKKPLHYYLGDNAADTHAFRFSANTLQRGLLQAGLKPIAVNRYVDNDVLCVIAEKSTFEAGALPADDADAVLDFFRRWHIETQAHYRDA